MNLGEARERYLRSLLISRDLSPHTLRAYDSDIAALERQLGRRGQVADLDRERMLAFIEGQRAAGLSASSLRRRASSLRGFCRCLLASELLDVDPGEARQWPWDDRAGCRGSFPHQTSIASSLRCARRPA
jgi:integrase/recombinase XerC